MSAISSTPYRYMSARARQLLSHANAVYGRPDLRLPPTRPERTDAGTMKRVVVTARSGSIASGLPIEFAHLTRQILCIHCAAPRSQKRSDGKSLGVKLEVLRVPITFVENVRCPQTIDLIAGKLGLRLEILVVVLGDWQQRYAIRCQ